jgi:hypothetical protein
MIFWAATYGHGLWSYEHVEQNRYTDLRAFLSHVLQLNDFKLKTCKYVQNDEYFVSGGTIKVQQTLCLTKHYTMETYWRVYV